MDSSPNEHTGLGPAARVCPGCGPLIRGLRLGEGSCKVHYSVAQGTRATHNLRVSAEVPVAPVSDSASARAVLRIYAELRRH